METETIYLLTYNSFDGDKSYSCIENIYLSNELANEACALKNAIITEQDRVSYAYDERSYHVKEMKFTSKVDEQDTADLAELKLLPDYNELEERARNMRNMMIEEEDDDDNFDQDMMNHLEQGDGYDRYEPAMDEDGYCEVSQEQMSEEDMEIARKHEYIDEQLMREEPELFWFDNESKEVDAKIIELYNAYKELRPASINDPDEDERRAEMDAEFTRLFLTEQPKEKVDKSELL